MSGRVIVVDGHIVTMDPVLGDLPVGDVLIVDGRVAEVGTDLDRRGAEVVEAAGATVLPGLVDGHRHLWQSLLRGTASDWSLPRYLVEARSLYCGCFDPEAAYLANYLGGLESIAAGITTVVDHSHLQSSPEMARSLASGLIDSGVGGVFCYALQNVPDYTTGDQIDVERLRDLITRFPDDWHDRAIGDVRAEYFADATRRLKLGIALPESAAYLPLELVRSLLSRIAQFDPFLLTGHWDGGGSEPVARLLAEAGEWPSRTSLTHGNHLGSDDLDSLARAGVGLCTTPDIECGMGTGPLMAARFLEHGGSASLGTDLSSYARSDILQQARLLLQLERATEAQAMGTVPNTVAWPARKALELATRGGAEALGLGDEVGSIVPGKRGDVIVVRPDDFDQEMDPVAGLLFSTSPSNVDTVIVEGDILKRHGRLVGVDHADLGRRLGAARARVVERYESLPRRDVESVWEGMFG